MIFFFLRPALKRKQLVFANLSVLGTSVCFKSVAETYAKPALSAQYRLDIDLRPRKGEIPC